MHRSHLDPDLNKTILKNKKRMYEIIGKLKY
jgi:hypothetical protein